MDIEAQKRQAAALAVEWVRPGMRLGLGTGSTAKHFVELLAERVRGGLNVVGVPTSETTRADAQRLGVPLTTLDETPELDMTVDGADEIGPDLTLDQGRRRRAAAGKDRGGGLGPHGGDRRREQMGEDAGPLSAADRGDAVRTGGDPARGRGRGRRRPDVRARPSCGRARTATLSSRTAGTGSWMPRCSGSPMPKSLADRLSAIPGVVEHGLFIGLAQAVILAGPTGARVVERS